MTSTPPAWRVTSQSPRTRVDSTGTPKDGYDIAFQTADGHNGTIWLPGAQYNVANAKAAISVAAAALDSVGSLTSES